MSAIYRILRKDGIVGFLVLFAACSVVWVVFLSFFWGVQFVPQIAQGDDAMHKTVIYFMLGGEDFYTAWRHAAEVCADLGDLRIYRTPIIFYALAFLTGWAGDYFVFPLSFLCVFVAASNLILSFWTTRRMLGTGWAGFAAAMIQVGYFFNVIPRFQLSLFAMPFLILAIYWGWTNHPWLASLSLALAFLIKEIFLFAFPALVVLFILRRQWRNILIICGIFVGAFVTFSLHLFIAQPTFDGYMLFHASIPELVQYLGGFLWFGFGAFYYNLLLPIAQGGSYPFSPIPPILPYPLFITLLIGSSLVIWGILAWLGISMIRTRKILYPELLVMSLVLWLFPVAITATTYITSFALWWVFFAIWRWFAPAYVGFQLLVAASWHNFRNNLENYFSS